MAVKISRSLVLPMLLLSISLLLFGCAENNQTVSEKVERSDFSGTGSSLSGSTTGRPDENKDIASDAPGAANAGDTEIDGSKGNQGKKAEGPEMVSGAKISEVNAKKSEANEDLTGNEGTRKESIPPGSNNNQPVEIKFSEMYAGSSFRGLKFSDKLTGLHDKKVVVTGYMAPPLKPSFTFFVLIRQPMAICPFCSTDASWPEDIILVYLPKGEDRTPTDSVLTVTSTLELGSRTDPDTGFVSQARIYSDNIKIVR